MASKADTTIPVSKETREKMLRPLKRGGESYDDLLRKMAEKYEPDAGGVNT